jgi:hypothetical protein
MLISGLAGIVLVEIYAAIMQQEFQDTNNAVGKAFAVLGIYLFAVVYCMCLPHYPTPCRVANTKCATQTG